MEEVTMLRHIIAHFHHFQHFSSSPFYVSFPSLHHSSSSSRWCFLNVDESSIEDEPNNVIIGAEKTGNYKTSEHYKSSEAKKPRKECCVKASGRVLLSDMMDEEIWKAFPEDLLEAVIARLPISTFFRLRTVSRKWNSFLQSYSFSQHCAQVPPQARPWFYTVTNETVAIYDSFMKKWRHPTDSSLPPKLILLPAAFAGGLVCLLDLSHTYVCNPLTRTYKELPARTVKVWSRVAMAMTLDGNSTVGGYKIVWVSENEFEVYDSWKNTWTCGDISPNIKLPLSLNLWSQAVSVSTTVYFLRLNPEGVVLYDTGSGIWNQFVIPNPPNSRDLRLAGCGARIMLVGLLTKNAATCVCVWELQKMTLLWKEVDRMPNAWCLEFYSKYVSMTCLGNMGLLMVSLRSAQMDRVVTYDVATREWSKIPVCTLPRGRKHGTAFYPRLADSP